MQYPVPQFTEVEDKLIGPLSLKQFFIVFVAGVLIFGGYSATKSTAALVIMFIIFGLPALGLAFVKINGRPIYRQMNYLLKYFFSPKVLTFHKEASSFTKQTVVKDVKLEGADKPAALSRADTRTKIKEIQGLLEKQREEEEVLIDKIDHH